MEVMKVTLSLMLWTAPFQSMMWMSFSAADRGNFHFVIKSASRAEQAVGFIAVSITTLSAVTFTTCSALQLMTF